MVKNHSSFLSCVICVTVAGKAENKDVVPAYNDLDLPVGLSSYASRVLGIRKSNTISFELFDYVKPKYGEYKTLP